MRVLRQSLILTATMLGLVCLAGWADAGFVTDVSAIPNPTKVVDFSQLGGFTESSGPVEIGGLVGESISWTASSGLSLIGGGNGASISYSFNASGPNGNVGNGVWDTGRGGFSGVNVAFDSSMTYTFNAGPVSAVGGFINYIPGVLFPGISDATITALGLGGVVLQTYDLNTLAPINTPGGVDAGAFRGIVDATADIYAFRVANRAIALDDLTFSRATPGAVPEPSSAILVGMGLLGTITAIRRGRRISRLR